MRGLRHHQRGLGRRALATLADAASAHLASAAGVEIETAWLPHPHGVAARLPVIWRTLSSRIGPRCIAIIGLGGRISHWTVAVEITDRQMRLLDSDGMSVLRREQCTPRPGSRHYKIEPRFVLLMRRMGRKAM